MFQKTLNLWGVAVPAGDFEQIQGLGCYLLAALHPQSVTPKHRRRAAETAAILWRRWQSELLAIRMDEQLKGQVA